MAPPLMVSVVAPEGAWGGASSGKSQRRMQEFGKGGEDEGTAKQERRGKEQTKEKRRGKRRKQRWKKNTESGKEI